MIDMYDVNDPFHEFVFFFCSRSLFTFNCPSSRFPDSRRAPNYYSGNEKWLHVANYILGGGILFTSVRSNHRSHLNNALVTARARGQ